MITLSSIFKKIGIFVVCFSLYSSAGNATVFTAVTSGNFNAALTWAGGIVPPSLVSLDAIVIPSGLTVTLNTDESFSGTSSLLINGTLTSGAFSSSLSMTGGTLAGTGSIQVDSLVLNMTSGISYTGAIVGQNVTSLGANITSATNITVNNSLTLASGALNIAAGTLTMGSGSTIAVMGGSLAASGIGTITLTNPYNVNYMTSTAVSGIELTGSGLTAVTVNVTGAVTMSNDVTMHGLLSLTAGTLMLNGYNLTLASGADVAASGTGTLSGTLASDITLATSGSLTGALRFASGGNVLNNLTLNMTGGTSNAALGSNLTLNGALNLMSGKLMLGANNLTLNTGAAVNGASSSSFVVTDAAGVLTRNLATGASDTFAVGTSANYAPLVVSAASGSAAGNVSVNLAGVVYSAGTGGTIISTTSPMVSATWFVSSDATSAINYNMTAMWNTSMEVNGFDRTRAYISHYTGGAWDVQTVQPSATAGAGMYSMTRTGITSLSPFRVADINSVPTYVPIVYQNDDLTLYPNPATSTINFTSTEKISSIDVYDELGDIVKSSDPASSTISVSELPSGLYFAHFTGMNINTVKRFYKQ